jgi:LysM repeat protein
MARMTRQLECAQCGASLSQEDEYCPVCGWPCHQGHSQRLCPECGAPVADRAKTCLSCGVHLDGAAASSLLVGLSWLRLGVVAVLVLMIVLGWRWWHGRTESVAGMPSPTPVVPATSSPTATATASPTITATPTATVPPATATPYIHVVQSGETVSEIAATYNLDADTLMALNDLDDEGARRLSTGQELIISPGGPISEDGDGVVPALPTLAPARQIIHIVQSGETLSSIAVQYDANLDAILQANSLSSVDLIYQGQEIIVPLDPPTPTPSPTMTATPTPTPGPPFAAPDLLYPTDGQRFTSPNASVMLLWTSVGFLDGDQAYMVVLDAPGETLPVTHLTRETSWRLPADLWPTGSHRAFTWQVVVMPVDPQTGEVTNQRPLSLNSSTRGFFWN